MARRDALLRLHKSLTARREDLRRRLGGELKDLRNLKSTDTGDSADAAFEAGSDDVSSQLAVLEARELAQIERALQRLKQGNFGVCEGCQKKIAMARLNALPFSTTCIDCQREMELYGTMGDGSNSDWEKVSDGPRALEDQREVDLSDIEMDISTNR
jgi:DnaK suppressor protein